MARPFNIGRRPDFVLLNTRTRAYADGPRFGAPLCELVIAAEDCEDLQLLPDSEAYCVLLCFGA